MTDTNEKMTPCPFCGKPGLIRQEGDHHGEWFNLGCVADVTGEKPCPGACPWYSCDMERLPEAIAAWNRRSHDLPDSVAAAVRQLRISLECPDENLCDQLIVKTDDLRTILDHFEKEPQDAE